MELSDGAIEAYETIIKCGGSVTLYGSGAAFMIGPWRVITVFLKELVDLGMMKTEWDRDDEYGLGVCLTLLDPTEIVQKKHG